MKFEEKENILFFPNIRCPIIYFLLDGDEVVYVGKSKIGLSRPYNHKNKAFTDIAIFECNETELDIKETELIKKYLPKYNKMMGNSDYSLTRTKNIMREQTNIHNFNNCDLKKVMNKLGIKSYIFENVEYINGCDFEKMFLFVKETSEGICNKNSWKKKAFN